MNDAREIAYAWHSELNTGPYRGAVLLLQVGGSYEAYDHDAAIVSSEVGWPVARWRRPHSTVRYTRVPARSLEATVERLRGRAYIVFTGSPS